MARDRLKKKRMDCYNLSKATKDEKISIMQCFRLGMSFRNIAKTVGRSVPTISRICKTYKENKSLERKPGSGRPRKTTTKEDHLIVREMKKCRSLTGKRNAGKDRDQ